LDDDDDVPFACLIGRHPFTDPIVTRCGHYFCSSCAIKRFAKTPKCAACGAPTGGIFNRADKVISKLKKMEAEEEEEHSHENIGDNVKIEGLNQSDSGHSDSDRED
jgi:RING finger protein 113A